MATRPGAARPGIKVARPGLQGEYGGLVLELSSLDLSLGVHGPGASPRTRPAPRQRDAPGWVGTPVWDQIVSPEVKQARLAGMAAQLPGGRIGHPEDIANDSAT
jgi:hypothetical protein